MAYQPNIGERPAAIAIWDETGKVVTGYRPVHVILHGGYDSKQRDVAPWPGGPPTDWRISNPPHPFQIKSWDLA